MKGRLTKRKWKKDSEVHTQIYQKLAEYEDLEEQGLLVRLPCKVGDKFWYINIKHEIVENTVYELGTCGGGIWGVYDSFSDWHLCENVYFTRAEGEKKLKTLIDYHSPEVQKKLKELKGEEE